MKLAKYSALDGWRGVLIASVVFSHTFWPKGLTGWQKIVECLGEEMGGASVDFFFSLSGYLISRELLRERGLPGFMSRFYVRRALRILPLYYGALALLTLFPCLSSYVIWGETRMAARGVAPDDWLFLSNLTMAFGHQWKGYFLLVGWSLCVEVQFYAIWPHGIARFGAREIKRSCAALVVGSLIARAAFTAAGWDVGVYILPWCRMDSFALGTLVALFAFERGHHRVWEEKSFVALAIGAAFATVLGFRVLTHSVFIDVIRHTIYGVFGALVIAVCAARGEVGKRTPWLELRPLRWMGKFSYGMYLFHLVVIREFYTLPLPWGLIVVVNFLGTFALASVLYYALEKPFLVLQNRFRLSENKKAPATKVTGALRQFPLKEGSFPSGDGSCRAGSPSERPT